METLPLGFSVWTDDDGGFFAPGQVANFDDKYPVSLLHKAKNVSQLTGKEITDIEFKIQLVQNDSVVAEHSFKNKKKNDTFWLIPDASSTDEVGSFSPKFAATFATLPAGEHNYTVKIFADGELFNEGQIIFNSNGENATLKQYATNIDNASEVREQANAQHQDEYAKQLAEDDRKQEEAREFKFHIKNQDSGHTKYVVETNQSSFSENIHEITPLQTITLSLFRGSQFELKYFDQDSSKEYAKFIAIIDESFHNSSFEIK